MAVHFERILIACFTPYMGAILTAMKNLKILISLLLLLGCTVTSHDVRAEEPKSEILNPQLSYSDILRICQGSGQAVDLHLRNGQTVSGKVSKLGDNFVVIKELKGREFYSAQVRIEAIDSLEVRAAG